MLLSDQDIALAWIGIRDPIALGKDFKDSEHVKNFAANLEDAILAKLASAELPAPNRHGGTYESSPFNYYTADQLRQAYAQGAASQLAQEPDYFTRQQFGCEREFCEKPFTTDWTPLFTLKELK